MRFDTFLKIGSFAADIWRHDSFQEMSKIVHKGVKRRMQNYDEYYRQYPSSHNQMFGSPVHKQRNSHQHPDRKQMLLPQQQKKNFGELITPESIQSAFQIHQTIKKFLNQHKE